MTKSLSNAEPQKDQLNRIKRVLIVDDSKVIRDRLVSMLSKIEEVEIVGEAINTHEALLLYQSTNPDFVILDIRIPGGGGFNVLQEIKNKTLATKVAVLTNYPYCTYRKHCMELGADFFFSKSTEFEKVKTIFTLNEV